MKYDTVENDTYNLYTITTDKFKSIHLEVVFRMNASKENITYMSMLSSILMENTKKYPSRKDMIRHLYDLYNANVYATSSRVGGELITNFVLEIVDPKYTEASMLEESIKFLFEAIMEPNVQEGEFDNATFERVKKRIKNDIESLKEDPKQSSILEALGVIDKDGVRGLNASGDLEVLDSITPKKLYNFYLEFLENSPRDVYVIGHIDVKTVDKIVKKYANFKSITSEIGGINLPIIKTKSTKSVSRDSSLTQANLVGIYTLPDVGDDEENYSIPLFNMLFGSGSLESKLYKVLREENSLCYNVTTLYQKYDKILILHTAIDEGNTKLAMKLINNTLNEMIKGNFREEDLENVKNLMITSLYLTQDSPNRLIDMYLFKNIAGLPDLEDRIDKIKEVKKEDIISVAKKLKLALVYRIKGGNGA